MEKNKGGDVSKNSHSTVMKGINTVQRVYILGIVLTLWHFDYISKIILAGVSGHLTKSYATFFPWSRAGIISGGVSTGIASRFT